MYTRRHSSLPALEVDTHIRERILNIVLTNWLVRLTRTHTDEIILNKNDFLEWI